MLEDTPLRVAVLTQQALIRAGLERFLAAHPHRALLVDAAPWTGGSGADVVVFDLAVLDDERGEQHLRVLLASATTVLGLTRDGRGALEARARALGLLATITERVRAEELAVALETAVGCRPTGAATPKLLPPLTEREMAVLTLVGSGLSNKQIADRLFVSINSVKTHIRTSYRKIGVTNRSGAVLWAVQHQLVALTYRSRPDLEVGSCGPGSGAAAPG